MLLLLLLRQLLVLRGYRPPGAERVLFPELTLDFFSGTVTAVMGANGSGKTTLLEVVGGRRSPGSGTVETVTGVDGPSKSVPLKLEDCNYVPQESSRLLFSHLTVAENIALRRGRDRDAPDGLISGLFPDSLLARYPASCSGGERQRAAICRAVMEIPDFPITLLDEPFSQLSGGAKDRLFPAIRDAVTASDAIVLLVTHDLFEGMILGDRVLVLASDATTVFDTSDISTEADAWERRDLRDDILRALRRSDHSWQETGSGARSKPSSVP